MFNKTKPERIVFEYSLHSLSYASHIVRIEQRLWKANNFGEARPITGNDRCAACHRLERWQSEALMLRRHDKKTAYRIQGRQIRFRNVARQH